MKVLPAKIVSSIASRGHYFQFLSLPLDSLLMLYSADPRTETLGRRLSNHNVFRKQKIIYFANDVFEGCFLRVQVKSNRFNVFNGCIYS